jgi:3-hydroxyisobutyrate dehydrogenase-like beta-hydroxyacid dehydrogenase
VPQADTIGYVELGHLGWPMASLLARSGHALVVHDLDPEREHRFAEENGCRPAGGIAGLAGAGMVITMLPNGHVVREVMLETDGGLADRLAPGSVVIDTSSSDPIGTRELGAELAQREISLLDAPVTRQELGNLRLTIMLGGDDESAIERAIPVLSVMAEHVFPVGPLGSGHALKTLNNFVTAAALVASLDALMIGARYGLDPETMLDVFNVGTARNFNTAHTLGQEALSRRYASGFQLALLVKDLGICSDLTETVGFETSFPSYVRDELAEALSSLGDEEADNTASLVHWERRAGLELPALRAS